MLGLCFCARALSSCGKWGPLFIAVRGPLTIAASLVAEHRLQTRRLSSCGPRAQLLRGTWDLPSPGLEPVYPALAGRLPTTAPPGKPPICKLYAYFQKHRRSAPLTPHCARVSGIYLHICSWLTCFPYALFNTGLLGFLEEDVLHFCCSINGF